MISQALCTFRVKYGPPTHWTDMLLDDDDPDLIKTLAALGEADVHKVPTPIVYRPLVAPWGPWASW